MNLVFDAPFRMHRLFFLLAWVLMLSFFFAQVEIQIEGTAGWAANLPTWRIEQHWLLDIFWGGRAMTGYHAWVFPFIALLFHFPVVLAERWSWRAEYRILACIMVFWICEDFLWFILNPAYGWPRFTPQDVPWHKHWLLGAPNDYWISLSLAATLLFFSFRKQEQT